jgi:hypothetical protein
MSESIYVILNFLEKKIFKDYSLAAMISTNLYL